MDTSRETHRKYNIKTEIQREETGRRGEPMEKPDIRETYNERLEVN
jgi:hypothetical protein